MNIGELEEIQARLSRAYDCGSFRSALADVSSLLTLVKELQAELQTKRDEIQKFRLERRGFQIMARNMLQATDPAWWQAAMQDGKYSRAGGDVECTICRLTYVEHPEIPGFPTFHVLCIHDIVKT